MIVKRVEALLRVNLNVIDADPPTFGVFEDYGSDGKPQHNLLHVPSRKPLCVFSSAPLAIAVMGHLDAKQWQAPDIAPALAPELTHLFSAAVTAAKADLGMTDPFDKIRAMVNRAQEGAAN